MAEDKSKNKGLIVLQTSLMASGICAFGLASHISLSNNNSFTEFMTVTYLAFINTLVMPVSFATIMYFSILRPWDFNNSWISLFKKTILLSIVSLFLIFLWNSLDIVFHYHNHQNAESILATIHEEFFKGLILCLPITFLVIFLFRILEIQKGK
jgi:hypothetical protein